MVLVDDVPLHTQELNGQVNAHYEKGILEYAKSNHTRLILQNLQGATNNLPVTQA
jgi:hypothetical protein